MPMEDCMYLTNEQCVALVVVTHSALVGCQIRTDASDDTPVHVNAVRYDHTEYHCTILPDGEIVETT